MSRTPLSRDRVIEAAVALADRIGIEPLTIRKLADELGVGPMTIYHHVANKEDILDGMVDTVFAEIELPPEDEDWTKAIALRARSAREVLARHRWAAPLMESRTDPGPATLGHHDAVLGCLRRAGMSWPLVGHAYAMIDAYIYGFALQEAGLPFDTPEEAVAMAEMMVQHFPADLYPNLAAFTFDHVLQPGYDFAAEFDVGLELILDGLVEAVAREQQN